MAEISTKNTASKVTLESGAVYCLCQHFKAYYQQCRQEVVADFSTPCTNCAKVKTCHGDWMEKILPVFEAVGMDFNMANPEP